MLSFMVFWTIFGVFVCASFLDAILGSQGPVLDVILGGPKGGF